MKVTNAAGGKTQAALAAVPGHDWVQLMRGRFRRFRFRRHAHDRLSVAVVVRGTMQVIRPGGSELARPGQVVTVHADQVHWGGDPGFGGWDIRTVFLDEEVLREYGRNVIDGAFGFPKLVSEAPGLAQELLTLHCSYEQSVPRLERDVRLHQALKSVIVRLSDGRARSLRRPRAPDAVRRAREFLDAHACENPSLRALSEAVGMGQYALTRCFSAHVGMPPHAYLLHRRVREAERALRAGRDVCEVALDCGFSDQSHLTRIFRQANGITPARFRAAWMPRHRP